MWIFFLTIFALKGASCHLTSVHMSNSAICDYVEGVQNTCKHHLPSTEDVVFVPTETDIDVTCPGWLEYNTCVKETLDTCHATSRVYIIAISQTEVMRDLCDKDSELRSDYLKAASCFNGFRYYYPYDTVCFEKARAAYEAYENSTLIHVYAVGGSEEKETCFIHAYAFACMTRAVGRVCGVEARYTALEILTRLKIIDTKCNFIYREEIRNQFFLFLIKGQTAEESDSNLHFNDLYTITRIV